MRRLLAAGCLSLCIAGCQDVERLGTVSAQLESAGRQLQAGGGDHVELRFEFGGDDDWFLIAVPATGFNRGSAIAAGVDEATADELARTFAGNPKQFIADVRSGRPEVRVIPDDALHVGEQMVVAGNGHVPVVADIVRETAGPPRLRILQAAARD